MTSIGGPRLTPPSMFTKEAVERYYFTGQGNELSEAGEALFRDIREHTLDPVPTSMSRASSLLMTGGVPGCGKGRLVEQLKKDHPPFAIVDADPIKSDVMVDLLHANPALQEEMEDCRNWATVVHRTSRVLAHRLMEEALETHKDVLFDSTLAAPNQQEYRDFVNTARAQGHDCEAFIARVQVRTAVERDHERAKTPVVLHLEDRDVTLHGRLVPPELIAGAEKGLQQNLQTFLSEGLFDHLTIYDNDREDQPLHQQASFQRVELTDGTTTSL